MGRGEALPRSLYAEKRSLLSLFLLCAKKELFFFLFEGPQSPFFVCVCLFVER